MGVLYEEIRATRDVIDYGFATGRVRVLESRTLDRSAFERLVDAPTFAEQKRILAETTYAAHLDHAHTAEDVEAGLIAALVELYGLLESSGLPDPVIRFVRVRHDYRNLKAMVRARVLGVSETGLLVPLGTVPIDAFSGEGTRLPEPFGSLVVDLLEMAEDESLDRGHLLEQIDRAVDGAMFADLRSCAAKSRSPFLVQLAQLFIDIANIKALMRSSAQSLPAATTRAMLFPGGSIKPERLMSLYGQPDAEIAAAVARSASFRGISPESIADLSTLDVAADNAIVRELRIARLSAPGPLPVVAYALARDAEAQALRVVLLGKLAGLDSEALHHRLREMYR